MLEKDLIQTKDYSSNYLKDKKRITEYFQSNQKRTLANKMHIKSTFKLANMWVNICENYDLNK